MALYLPNASLLIGTLRPSAVERERTPRNRCRGGRLDRRPLLYPNWTCVCTLQFRCCQPVISHLTTSAVWCLINFRLHSSILFCLCVHNQAPFSHPSNRTSVSSDVTLLFRTSGCFLSLHMCSLCRPCSSLYVVITVRPWRYNVQKPEDASLTFATFPFQSTTKIYVFFRLYLFLIDANTLTSHLISICFILHQLVVYCLVHYFHHGRLWWEKPDAIVKHCWF